MDATKLKETDCSVLKKQFLIFIFLLSVGRLSAHEFWLEPINYQREVGQKVRVHEKVGQGFKGNKYAYLETSYQFLNLTQGEETRAVKSRLGDLPAINETVAKAGLVIISAETTPSDVSYETWKKFEDFIRSKGLDPVLLAHKKRGLPEKNFVESYRRYAKTLLKVGHGKGQDRALGLGFEWVLATNPYTTEQGAIKAQLLWQGAPHAKAHVSVFNRLGDALIKTDLITDADGRVEIPRANGGQFLLNAVKMIKAPIKMQQEKNAVWESRWASITYELEVLKAE